MYAHGDDIIVMSVLMIVAYRDILRKITRDSWGISFPCLATLRRVISPSFHLNRERLPRIFLFISVISERNSHTSQVLFLLFRARPTTLPRQTSDIESRQCSSHFMCLFDSSLRSSREIYLLLFNPAFQLIFQQGRKAALVGVWMSQSS